MPKKKEQSFALPSLDDIFSTQEIRDDEKLRKVRDIPIELIDDFPDHSFKVIENEDMMELVESIRNRGVLTPTVVREKEDLSDEEYHELQKYLKDLKNFDEDYARKLSFGKKNNSI